MVNRLLVVEDSPADIDIMQQALNMFEHSIEPVIVENGVEALEHLESVANGEKPPPDLILLDLDMPKMSGFEVLEEIKYIEEVRHIPVVVLTMSAAEEDINKGYRLGANCCITKPLGIKEFNRVLKALNNFWFEVATIPEKL